MSGKKQAQRQILFELFNEIGIIHQLATAEFNTRLPDGVHVSHFGVINHMVRVGDGWTPLRIAKAFQVTKATMTNTIAKLEAKGLVEVRVNPEDGRSKLVYLTDSGRAFRADAIAQLNPVLDALDKSLGAGSLAESLPNLRRLRCYMDETREPKKNGL